MFTPTSSHTYYQLPFPVHYVAQSYRTVPYTHEDSAHLRVLARLLSWKFLHREIRLTHTHTHTHTYTDGSGVIVTDVCIIGRRVEHTVAEPDMVMVFSHFSLIGEPCTTLTNIITLTNVTHINLTLTSVIHINPHLPLLFFPLC